jgi:uncharacterized membrane protein YhaH (DUF805 family)
VGFLDAVKSGFSKYFQLQGRACRSELWFWQLFVLAGGFVLGQLDLVMGMAGPSGFGPLYGVFAFLTLVPGLTVVVRRLHDVEKSGWWYPVIFIVCVGAAILAKTTTWQYLIGVTALGILLILFWFIKPGTKGSNRFGDDPLAPAGEAREPDETDKIGEASAE